MFINFENLKRSEIFKVFQKYFYSIDIQLIKIFNTIKSYPKQK